MSSHPNLTSRERHLAQRLEGFGDVVFGFAIAQLALQLDLPKTPGDLVGHPIKYVLYFGTFGLLAILWLAFHRMLTGAYRPGRLDLVITFAYLAFVGLVPFAMYANVHFAGTAATAVYGLATYQVCALGTAATCSAITFRNLVRGRASTDVADLRAAWRTGLATAWLSVVMLVALVANVAFGATVGGPLMVLLAGASIARRIELPKSWRPPAPGGTIVPEAVS